MDPFVPIQSASTSIWSVWNAMKVAKGDLEDRCEEYARLTVPHICSPDNQAMQEQEKGNVMIGAKIVNFLANKVVSVVFPHDKPFFILSLDPKVEFDLSKQVPTATIDQSKSMIADVSLRISKYAMKKLNMIEYRPMAIHATKHLIVTGNAIIRRLPNNKRVVYGVKDAGIFRSIDGEPYDVVLRDIVRFDALDADIQERVKASKVHVNDDDVMSMYSRWKKKGQKWEFTQAVDDISLGTFKMVAEKDLPIMCLTWNLSRGEHWGRGLVEDNIVSFSNLDVSTTALIDMFGIAADIKFLVNPGSVLDLLELTTSKRGSFHYGAEGDITSPQIGNQKGMDMQVLAESIAKWERELSQTFLMTSGSIRDAERVTAEEVRFYAQEIESAFGGLYSMLSQVWQYKEAEWAVRQIDDAIPKTLTIDITTGLDALSQEAMLQNLRYSLADLGLLNTVPEDVRAELSAERIAMFIFANRNLPYAQFKLSPEEKQAKQEQQMQVAGRMQQMETEGKVTEQVAKAATE